jgi:hypothetical protein
VYDVFAEIRNPHTSLLIIDPQQKLSLRIYFDGTRYTGEAVTQESDAKNSPYRVVFKSEKKDGQEWRVVSYSNEFNLRVDDLSK